MEDQAVGKISPLGGRKNFRQIFFDLHRVQLPGESQAAREALAMRIDGDTGRVEGVAENHVGGLATDAGEAS